MPFSKFDPHRPGEKDALAATTPGAARKVAFLKWANWIVLVYTAIGFGIIAYLVAQKFG